MKIMRSKNQTRSTPEVVEHVLDAASKYPLGMALAAHFSKSDLCLSLDYVLFQDQHDAIKRALNIIQERESA